MQATRALRVLLTTAVAAVIGSGCCVTVPPERNRAVEQSLRETRWASAREPAPTLAPSPVTIYAPSTTSSVPVILAARQLAAQEDTDLAIFDNHSQANTLFLRGDVDILVTGLSVGAGFFRNGAPVQVINCNVSGLTYLVTRGRQVKSFAELRGEPLVLPFEGSPIEETTRFFAEQEGLTWKQDIVPVYAPSDSSLALLAQGKAAAVALPEPYASLAEQQDQVYVSIGYRDRWDALPGTDRGYPQVCALVLW